MLVVDQTCPDICLPQSPGSVMSPAWTPPCSPRDPNAVRAVAAAGSEQCRWGPCRSQLCWTVCNRRELVTVACGAEAATLHPLTIPGSCDRWVEDRRLLARGGRPLGCFNSQVLIYVKQYFFLKT